MLHVNDDNNDELFRKAAADYFLGANNPDFSTVNNKMDDGVVAPVTQTNCKKEKQKRYYWMPVAGWFNNKPVYKAVSMFRNLLQGKSKKKISARFLYRCICIVFSSQFLFRTQFLKTKVEAK